MILFLYDLVIDYSKKRKSNKDNVPFQNLKFYLQNYVSVAVHV